MLSHASLIGDLEDAIASGSPERRHETLRRVTDLFQHSAPDYSEDQVAIFDDVIGRLAHNIETQARSELANRLAPIANAPTNVIRSLAADDDIAVAGPVLSQSVRLDDTELVNNARTKGQDHLLAISQRSSLTEAVTDVLVTRGDQQVVRTVARNVGARFSDTGFETLVTKSASDDVLATSVGLRKDIPSHHMRQLVVKASDAVRKKLAAANPAAASEIEKVIADVSEKAVLQTRDYTPAKAAIAALQRQKKLDDEAVHDLAKAGKFEDVIVALSALSRLPLDQVERSVWGTESDLILILARAAGLSWSTTKAVLVCLSSGRGSLQDLEAAEVNFNRLQIATAQRVIRFYQVRQVATKSPS